MDCAPIIQLIDNYDCSTEMITKCSVKMELKVHLHRNGATLPYLENTTLSRLFFPRIVGIAYSTWYLRFQLAFIQK